MLQPEQELGMLLLPQLGQSTSLLSTVKPFGFPLVLPMHVVPDPAAVAELLLTPRISN